MRLQVASEVFVPSPCPGVGVMAGSFYTDRDRPALMSLHWHISRSDTADVAYIRFSQDNGRSWERPELLPTRFADPAGTGRRHPRGGYLDPISGRFISLWTEGVLATDHPLEGMRSWTLWYSVSEDGGRTQRVSEQIIADAPGCDARHPLPDVTVGRNCVMIGDLGCRPLTLDDGTILVPAQSSPVGPDGQYWNPAGGLTYTDAIVLRGRWRPDGRLAWEESQRIVGDPERSTRGMIEPTLARLDGGRLLAVMRGSNDRRPELPGYKWFATSVDGGRTWSAPEPWRYSDGETFHSPSSCSQLIEHSSGRLFWVGNLCRTNPAGNAPRYPLVLAELDRRTGLVLRESVTILADRGPQESEKLTLSNFLVREDRETGELVLHLTRFFARPGSVGRDMDWTADAMLYRIRLEG